MYNYPANKEKYFANLLEVTPEEHTMKNSLIPYMDMKVHPSIEDKQYKEIIVRGNFNRLEGISSKEKNDKMFNYIRPTATIQNEKLYINCFPGIDYVYHYGNIMKTYLSLKESSIKVTHIIPTEEECWAAIIQSGLEDVPVVHTVVMGYVEGLQELSDESEWHGSGNFLWKKIKLKHHEGILLGCKHSYWGEIAGRIVKYLAKKGIKCIIYSGKLGTLDSHLIPNTTLATGNTSILPNGKTIFWNNLFSDILDCQVAHGIHITVPSVLQETKVWLKENCKSADFVDPEIGHMANAAIECDIQFSYLHIVSDNLSKKFKSDLSNERQEIVIEQRKQLYKKICNTISQL